MQAREQRTQEPQVDSSLVRCKLEEMSLRMEDVREWGWGIWSQADCFKNLTFTVGGLKTLLTSLSDSLSLIYRKTTYFCILTLYPVILLNSFICSNGLQWRFQTSLYILSFLLQLVTVFLLPFQFSGKGNGNPLQYSCLANPLDGGAWQAAVHAVATSWARLNDFTFTFHFHALEKEMATHSSVLAWRIPETGEPGGLSSMGSHRVGHD